MSATPGGYLLPQLLLWELLWELLLEARQLLLLRLLLLLLLLLLLIRHHRVDIAAGTHAVAAGVILLELLLLSISRCEPHLRSAFRAT